MIEAVATFIDTHSAVIGLLILAFMFVEFVRERYPVTVATNDSTPLFDPNNERVKA